MAYVLLGALRVFLSVWLAALRFWWGPFISCAVGTEVVLRKCSQWCWFREDISLSQIFRYLSSRIRILSNFRKSQDWLVKMAAGAVIELTLCCFTVFFHSCIFKKLIIYELIILEGTVGHTETFYKEHGHKCSTKMDTNLKLKFLI